MTDQYTADPSMSGGSDGDRLPQAAGEIADRTSTMVQERVNDTVGGQMSRAGDMMESVAQAIRRTGEQLRQEQPQVAGFADTAAGQVERFAGRVRTSSPGEIVAEVEQFARRQPAVFLGGALLLGAVAARFLKASPQAGSGMSAGYRGAGQYQTGDYVGGRYMGSGMGTGMGSDLGSGSTMTGSDAYGSADAYGSSGAYGSTGGYGSAGTTIDGDR
jgi:hypothetical protein